MGSREDFEPKTPGEQIKLVFNFASDSSSSVSSASVSCAVFSGTDASPSSMVSGAAAVSGSTVTQLIVGGVAGVVYYLACTATMSDGQILQRYGFLAVVEGVI